VVRAMLTHLQRVRASALAGLLAGIALAALLIVIAPPLDAALVVTLGVFSLRSRFAHRQQGSVPFVLLGMSAITLVGIVVVLTH